MCPFLQQKLFETSLTVVAFFTQVLIEMPCILETISKARWVGWLIDYACIARQLYRLEQLVASMYK